MSIKSHFFGKDCIIDRALLDRKDIDAKLSQQGFRYDQLLFVNQVHSNEVVVIDDRSKLYDMDKRPSADALVTNLKHIAIGVFTADCGPIIFRDDEHDIIAVSHAGWRGAKSGIIANTVQAMRKLGARNIKATLGPTIQQESYEISQEFFDDFIAQDNRNRVFFKKNEKPGHYMFDLPAYVLEKLEAENFVEIKNMALDTYGNEADYFSFRRSTHRGEVDCGRNVSVAVVG